MIWVALSGWMIVCVLFWTLRRAWVREYKLEEELRAARSCLRLAPAMLTIPDFDWMTETGMANYREWAGIQR